jgi:hypothetical protein
MSIKVGEDPVSSTDYLIVGAGAVGLAFADTLLDEDPDCHITFVDKHARPGGHWNDAYSFVALHQPSAFYGVNSMEFPDEHIDDHGPNEGLYALASGTEVSAYFEKVMNMRLLPSGRVAYHRLSEYRGGGKIVSILSGEETQVSIRRKTVDATFYQTSVPSTHTRQFAVADGVDIVAPGALPELWKRVGNLPGHFVILGAGKTAMDTGVWLIEAGVDPDSISWVRPRESWLNNRKYLQPGEEFFESTIGNQLAHLNAVAKANSGDEIFETLEKSGHALRIDVDIKPEMYHYAVISEGEIAMLRRIKRVLRDGRVVAIEPGKLRFERSSADVPGDSLFIDCTATAVPFSVRDEQGPQFRGDTIVLQPLHVPLVTFSAALTAFLEANFDDDETKNALGTAGPLTDSPNTFPYAFMINIMNRGAWSQNEKIAAWLAKARLDPGGPTVASLMAKNSPKLKVLGGLQQAAMAAIPNLMKLGAEAKALHEAD